MKASEGLDGDKEEDSEVVKPKVKRNPPKICESSDSDCEDSEVVEPAVRKPPKGLDSMSMEDWDLRLICFVRMLTLKKICKSIIFFFILVGLMRKKYESEISTLGKIFIGQKWQNFSWVTKILSDEKLCPTKIVSDIFLFDNVKEMLFKAVLGDQEWKIFLLT